METTDLTALDRAIAIIGSQKRLADLLGIKPPSVHEWVVKGAPPAERCRAIEAATGGQVTVHELRPDIFGPPPAAPASPSAEQAA